jgi:hypothetical protein
MLTVSTGGHISGISAGCVFIFYRRRKSMNYDKLEKSAREMHKNGNTPTQNEAATKDESLTPAEQRSVSSWSVAAPLRGALTVATVSSLLAWF